MISNYTAVEALTNVCRYGEVGRFLFIYFVGKIRHFQERMDFYIH